MREETTTRTLYKFNELSEDAKGKAIQDQADINVDYEWWYGVYEDAENVGLKITEFDLDRYRHAKGKFINSAEETAEAIKANHGESCESYKTAEAYLQERELLVKKYSDGIKLDIVAEDNEYEFDNECDDIDAEFLKSILEDYSIMLQHEYEYLTSSEAIKEIIDANEYEFTVDGKLA
jgi:flagellar capping protein FliD